MLLKCLSVFWNMLLVMLAQSYNKVTCGLPACFRGSQCAKSRLGTIRSRCLTVRECVTSTSTVVQHVVLGRSAARTQEQHAVPDSTGCPMTRASCERSFMLCQPASQHQGCAVSVALQQGCAVSASQQLGCAVSASQQQACAVSVGRRQACD